eukprot:1658122-Pleurochrysis_carterae.AAC.1
MHKVEPPVIEPEPEPFFPEPVVNYDTQVQGGQQPVFVDHISQSIIPQPDTVPGESPSVSNGVPASGGGGLQSTLRVLIIIIGALCVIVAASLPIIMLRQRGTLNGNAFRVVHAEVRDGLLESPVLLSLVTMLRHRRAMRLLLFPQLYAEGLVELKASLNLKGCMSRFPWLRRSALSE